MDPVIDDVLVAVQAREWDRLRLLLHPYLHWTDANGRTIRGRNQVLARLTSGEVPGAPTSYDLRDGQVYRWREATRAR